jgi:hypothetical protein
MRQILTAYRAGGADAGLSTSSPCFKHRQNHKKNNLFSSLLDRTGNGGPTDHNGKAVVDLILSMAKREVTFFSGRAAMSCL